MKPNSLLATLTRRQGFFMGRNEKREQKLPLPSTKLKRIYCIVILKVTSTSVSPPAFAGFPSATPEALLSGS